MKKLGGAVFALTLLLALCLVRCGGGEESSGPGPVNGSGEGIALDGVPLSGLGDMTWEKAAEQFSGQPTMTPEQGRHTLEYPGIHIYTSNGMVFQIDVEDPALLTKDGASLALDRDGLAEVLGEPAGEEQGEAGYNIWYEFEDFTLSFLNGERNGTQWDVTVSFPFISF